MRTGGLRAASRLLADLAIRLMPPAQRDWAEAMKHEAEAIDHAPSALLFAADCVRGALFSAIRDRAFRGSPDDKPGPTDMNPSPARRVRDPLFGILCAACAVGLGVCYMLMAGAPPRLIIVNLAALLTGSGLCFLLTRSRGARDALITRSAPVLGALLLATAVFGTRADGAARWVDLAGLVVQPSLLFIPLILVAHSRRADAWTATGVALSIAATALQPDRAMAGVLAGVLALLMVVRPRPRDLYLVAAAAAGFGITLVRPDRGGVSPFVDRILFTSFEVNPLAGACVALGALVLILPTLFQTPREEDPSTRLAFGAVWTLVVLAALVGNYPTPLVGYGGSAIVGYLLSLAAWAAVPAETSARTKPSHAALPDAGTDADAGPRIASRRRTRTAAVVGLPVMILLFLTACTPRSPDAAPETRRTQAPVQEIPLWPADLEIAQPELDGDLKTGLADGPVAGRPWTYIANVARPTMTVYPPRGPNTGAAMMVFPGGGYQVLAIDLEGTEICDWITSRGMTCVLLKYRVPHSGHSWSAVCKCRKLPAVPLALQDAQRALKLLRSRADAFAVDPGRIGVIGFSAGGHLVADVSNADGLSYEAVDAVDTQSSRPDFAVSVYPGHLWSGRGLEPERFKTISKDAPPTFLLHAQDDPVDDVRHSIVYFLELQKAKIPVEMHIFPEGGHAFGLRPTGKAIDRWPDLVERWLRSTGVLAADQLSSPNPVPTSVRS